MIKLPRHMAFRKLFFLAIVVSAIALPKIGSAESIWEKRNKAVQAITQAEPSATEPARPAQALPIDRARSAIDPTEITVPDQYGTIIDTHKGTNGKLIVHIQDAHANYEAQKNEAGILESLIQDFGLTLILREGGVSDGSLAHLRSAGSPDARRRAAETFLKKALITGTDYLDVVYDYPIAFQGIEDKVLYDINGQALWEMDEFKDVATEYVDKLIAASNTLKSKAYNQDLLEIDNKKVEYENDKIDLLEYYGYLYKKAEEQDIPLYTFPNFQSLIKASRLEKEIDMAKVQAGTASGEDMGLYDEYLEATRDLNINQLFKEEPLLEGTVQDILASNPDQRTLVRISKALSIMKNLLRIKVVPEEYSYFLENKKDFNPEAWSGFLKGKSEELGLGLSIPANHYVISDNLPKVERFYSTAFDREKAFLRKTNERMDKDNVTLAALVAGGFHTPTLAQLLADSGYSYVVVSPKVTTETDEELYRAALKR